MIVACSDNDATTHCMLVGVGVTRSWGRYNHIHARIEDELSHDHTFVPEVSLALSRMLYANLVALFTGTF